jgi:hypothetical protein
VTVVRGLLQVCPAFATRSVLMHVNYRMRPPILELRAVAFSPPSRTGLRDTLQCSAVAWLTSTGRRCSAASFFFFFFIRSKLWDGKWAAMRPSRRLCEAKALPLPHPVWLQGAPLPPTRQRLQQAHCSQIHYRIRSRRLACRLSASQVAAGVLRACQGQRGQAVSQFSGIQKTTLLGVGTWRLCAASGPV